VGGRNDGRMEQWKNGRMEQWKNGRMECWKKGIVEGWNDWKDGGGDSVGEDNISDGNGMVGLIKIKKDTFKTRYPFHS
jgi:hypothetical protein